jgi:hypothetical protein
MRSLEDLKAVCEAATPGPWKTLVEDGYSTWIGNWAIEQKELLAQGNKIEVDCQGDKHKENASYIATFNPQLVAALIDEVMASRLSDDLFCSMAPADKRLFSNACLKTARKRLDEILEGNHE